MNSTRRPSLKSREPACSLQSSLDNISSPLTWEWPPLSRLVCDRKQCFDTIVLFESINGLTLGMSFITRLRNEKKTNAGLATYCINIAEQRFLLALKRWRERMTQKINWRLRELNPRPLLDSCERSVLPLN